MDNWEEKLSSLLEKAFAKVKAFYNREDVQQALTTLKSKFKDVYGWVVAEIENNPAAATAGAVAMGVVVIALSGVTMGIVASLAVLGLCVTAAHYYFTNTRQAGIGE